jgi:hypothetical protein
MEIVELDIDPARPDVIRVSQRVNGGQTVIVVIGLSLISAVQIVAANLGAGISLALLIPVYGVGIAFLTTIIWYARISAQASHPLPPVLLRRPSEETRRKWQVWNAQEHRVDEYDAVLDLKLDRVRNPGNRRHIVFTTANALIAVCQSCGDEPQEVLIAIQPWAPRMTQRLAALRSSLGAVTPQASRSQR